jgi:signal peptidase I
LSGTEVFISSADNIELIRAVIAQGASYRFQAKGFSMCPFIRSGDVITIAPLGPKKIHTGDVVAFINPQNMSLLVHRVVARNGSVYRIKGDNVWSPDGVVPLENILGYISKAKREGRDVLLGLGKESFLIAFLSSKLAFFSLLMSVWKLIRPVFVKASPG